MQAAKRGCKAPPTRDLNIWLCGRQTDLSYGRNGRGKVFLGQSIGVESKKNFFQAWNLLIVRFLKI